MLQRLQILTLLCFAIVGQLHATHIRAGQITVARSSCASQDFVITVTVYTNTGSPILFSSGGLGVLSFGDGTTQNPPQTENSPVPGYGTEYGYVSYSTTHTYTQAGQFTISYFEHNRDAGILNMSNSVSTPFYVETSIMIDPLLGCDNSPVLLIPPIDQACLGIAWLHNPGAYDPDGDSLSYELSVPMQGAGSAVSAYTSPNAKTFYDLAGINYSTANELMTSPPTFLINPTTGTLVWDSPGAEGEYCIAFRVKEWRKIGGEWSLLGYVTRDMQVIVNDCVNHRPELDGYPDDCFPAGDTISGGNNLIAEDKDFDSVRLTAYSEIFLGASSQATFKPLHNTPTGFQYPNYAGDYVAGIFTWVADCHWVRERPYQVVFKATDKPGPSRGPGLSDFKTWNIKVIGKAPNLKSAIIDQTQRSAKLSWDPYLCGADSLQIWRRVGHYPYMIESCVIDRRFENQAGTGALGRVGYELIVTVPVADTSYIDTNKGTGLASGAVYCYRLLATFPKPGGGKSKESVEVCTEPVPAKAPVITNVTVDKTDSANGQVTVRWRPPFDADQGQFPPPYRYEVYRAPDLSGNANLVSAHVGKLTDTVFVDTELNTRETAYHYRVKAFDKNMVAIDTSVAASSIQLKLNPQSKSIEIDWRALTPWSDQFFPVAPPFFDIGPVAIYRGPSTSSTLADMELIDSTYRNYTSSYTLLYIDSGQFGRTFEKSQTYCYCVKNLGSYRNVRIAEPLVNYSQIACARAGLVTGELTPSLVSLHLYPNPSRDYLIIEGLTGKAGSSAVIDALGRTTPIELEEDQDNYKADIRFLSSGVYVLVIDDRNAIRRLKFVKQN